jgi:hypothetical protein
MGKKAQRLSQSWTWTTMGRAVSDTESKRADAMVSYVRHMFDVAAVAHNAGHGRSSGSGMCKRSRVEMEGNGAKGSCQRGLGVCGGVHWEDESGLSADISSVYVWREAGAQ